MDKRLTPIVLIASVFGCLALLIVLAGLLFMAAHWSSGQSGKPDYVMWDENSPESLRGPVDARVAPRIILNGERIDGTCEYFLGLAFTPDGRSTYGRTIREEPAECRKVVEVWTGPR